MKRAILIVVGLLVIVTGALFYLQIQRPAPRAVDLLPETTLLFLDAPNFARSRVAFQQTAASALWREPAVQAFLVKPRQALHDALGAGATGEENTAARLFDSLQGEVFLAVTSVTVIPNIQAGVVIGADVKGRLLQTKVALANFERKFRKRNPAAVIEDKKYLGVSYTVWQQSQSLTVCYSVLNSLVVFTLGEDTMRDTITRFTHRLQTPSPSLAASASLRNVLGHLAPNHEAIAYLNIQQIVALIGPFLALAPQGSGVLQKLGSLQAAGASAAFVDGAIQEVRFTAYNPPGQTPAAVTQRQTLALTAPQTALYLVQSSDLAGLYDQVTQALAQSGQPALSAGFTRFENSLRTQGVQVRDDVLARLGPETAGIGQWRPGAQWPDVALVAAARPTAKTRPALDAVMNALKETALGNDQQMPWDETQHRGHTLRTVRLGAGKIAPTYVATDKYFILATTADYARELLDQAIDSKPTLASSSDYQRAMKPLPTTAISAIYCDLRALYPPLHALARNALADASPGFLDLKQFPPPETVTKHLFPFASVTTADQTSQTTTSYSPFGTPIGLVAGAVGVAAATRVLAFSGLPAMVPVPPTSSSDKGVHRRPREHPAAPSRTANPG